MNGCCLSIESDVQSFRQLDWELVVAFSAAEVRASELKVVILVPVFEGELGERGSIGKLEVSKVPVKDLTIARREVDRTVWAERNKVPYLI